MMQFCFLDLHMISSFVEFLVGLTYVPSLTPYKNE